MHERAGREKWARKGQRQHQGPSAREGANLRSLTVGDLVGDDVDAAVAGDTNLRGQVAEIDTDDALWVSDGVLQLEV